MPGTGYLPTPPGHPALGAPSLSAAADAAKVAILRAEDIPPFRRKWTSVPMAAQGPQNSCVPTVYKTMMEVALAEAGLYRGPLSASFLYTLINRGADGGSSPGEALQALRDVGIAPEALVPPGVLGPPGYSPGAVAAAGSVRLADYVTCRTWQEVLNAAWFGWPVQFDLHADPDLFSTDARGFAPLLPGPHNHAVFAGEQYQIVDGTPAVGGRNPWGPGWGVGGRCWWTRDHFEAAREVYAIRVVVVSPDLLPPGPRGS